MQSLQLVDNNYKLFSHMYWYPQALLTAEQACRKYLFVVKVDAHSFEMFVVVEVCVSTATCYIFAHVPKAHHTKFKATSSEKAN